MSLLLPFSPSGSISALLVAAARQVLIAGAAVVGVMLLSGCSRQSAGQGLAERHPPLLNPAPTMQSGFNRQSEPRLTDVAPEQDVPASIEAPHPASVSHPASPKEQYRSRREAIASLVNEAMTPPALPAARPGNGPAGAGRPGSLRTESALRVAEQAITPLADTLSAIDVAQRAIVENLRNAETPGFKVSRTAIDDGRDVASQLDGAQAELLSTQRALDVAVQGAGFLQIRIYTPEHPEGAVGYTRNGRLFMNRNGEIVVGQLDGYLLIPSIKLPPGVTQVTILQNGTIEVVQAAVDSSKSHAIGRINLALFTDPTALRPMGGGLYAETEASGQAIELPAGERNSGAILQGHLESSNVDLIRERMRLRFLQTWRANILGAMEGGIRKDAAAARDE